MSTQTPSAHHDATTAPASGGDTPAPGRIDADRRAALAKLGALSAWTAPAMLTLVLTPRTAAAS